MQKPEVLAGIRAAWALVCKAGLGETISSSAPLEVHEEFRNLILRENANYVSVYAGGLRLGHYNFLLTDYSYFQFSWSAESHVRYAYYPNPFVLNQEFSEGGTLSDLHTLLAEGVISVDEYQSYLAEAKVDVRIPLIRYENAPSQYVMLEHPCSHLHIGNHAENRWPLNRRLTPQAFTLWIMKLYYGSEWGRFWKLDNGQRTNALEAELAQAKAASVLVGGEFFGLLEQRCFHFG